MAFRNYYAEMELPTVIIDMPELQRIASRKKAQHAIMYILAALTFVGLSGLIYLELTAQTKEVVKAETLEVKDDASGSLKLTVKLAPQNVVGAVVEVDGEVISGNPPYVYIEPSEEYHSIKISAPGYEVMSKDVQVTASEVMTFSLIAKDSTKLADNSDIDASDDTDRLSDSDFEPNSDDLIEEIEDGDFGTRLSGQEKRRGKGRLAGPGGKVGGVAAGRHGKGGRDDSGSAIRSVSVSFGPSPSQPAASAGGMTSAMQSSPQPVSNGGGAAAGGAVGSAAPRQPAAQASLIVNAPLGVTSRVRVSVDGQMRGYLPVLLKVDPGLHELTFMTEGRRTFQMVKLNPGQIVRIIPNL